MNPPLQLPNERTRAAATERPLCASLAFWADDLRARGLITEASYMDAARLRIQTIEPDAEGHAAEPALIDDGA